MNMEEAADILRKLNYIQCTGEPTIDEQMAAVKMALGCLEYGKNCIAALRGPQPDPDTGLVPCGCGGKAKIWLSNFTRFTHVITDYEVGCTECAMTTGWVRGKQEDAMNVWNTAMGGVVISSLEKTTDDVGTTTS